MLPFRFLSYGIFNFQGICFCKVLTCVSLMSIGALLAASSLDLQLTTTSLDFDMAKKTYNGTDKRLHWKTLFYHSSLVLAAQENNTNWLIHHLQSHSWSLISILHPALKLTCIWFHMKCTSKTGYLVKCFIFDDKKPPQRILHLHVAFRFQIKHFDFIEIRIMVLITYLSNLVVVRKPYLTQTLRLPLRQMPTSIYTYNHICDPCFYLWDPEFSVPLVHKYVNIIWYQIKYIVYWLEQNSHIGTYTSTKIFWWWPSCRHTLAEGSEKHLISKGL